MLVTASSNLGNLYHEGSGVPQDYSEARRLFTIAAEAGDSDAQLKLADLYERGAGVRENQATAIKWYRLAAEQGNVLAQAQLGGRYLFGIGIPEDYVLAHMWFNLAASSSENMPATKRLAQEKRGLVEQRMTREQIAEAQRLAREWKPKNKLVPK